MVEDLHPSGNPTRRPPKAHPNWHLFSSPLFSGIPLLEKPSYENTRNHAMCYLSGTPRVILSEGLRSERKVS